MSLTNVQISQTPCYTDFPFHNYGATDIVANVGVIADAAHDIASNNYGVGVAVVATPSTDIPIGVTMETIPAGGYGRVRCFGPLAQMKADGAITAGTYVDLSATALKVGYCKAHTATYPTIGIALNAATNDGDLVLVMLVGSSNV